MYFNKLIISSKVYYGVDKNGINLNKLPARLVANSNHKMQ